MDTSSARLYIALLHTMSLHSGGKPASILLKQETIIGAEINNCAKLLNNVVIPFGMRWMNRWGNNVTLIGSIPPCLPCSRIIVSMGIQHVFYLTPSHSASSLTYMKASGITVKRLFLHNT